MARFAQTRLRHAQITGNFLYKIHILRLGFFMIPHIGIRCFIFTYGGKFKKVCYNASIQKEGGQHYENERS